MYHSASNSVVEALYAMTEICLLALGTLVLYNVCRLASSSNNILCCVLRKMPTYNYKMVQTGCRKLL